MNETDKKWIDALRLFMGDGTGPVPFYKSADGSVDAVKTMTATFGLFGIQPRKETV
jgi:hypothetical protein